MQVGIGHSFSLGATGWKWKLTSCLGGDNVSRIRNKTSVGLCDGVDLRFGWRADYVLPEISGWVLNLLHYTLDECKSCFTQLSTVSYCCGDLCKKCCYFDIVWELRVMIFHTLHQNSSRSLWESTFPNFNAPLTRRSADINTESVKIISQELSFGWQLISFYTKANWFIFCIWSGLWAQMNPYLTWNQDV